MSLDKSKYSETIDHLLIKKFFYDNLPVANEIKTIEQEIKIGNRIADVYLELKDGKTVVSLYYKDLFVGDWKMEEVDFKAGATLTIAELDIRMKIHMEGG